jgi:hypothetical protein
MGHCLDICHYQDYIPNIPLAMGRHSRGYSLRRSGSGSRAARRYTAPAGGLGNVPSGACPDCEVLAALVPERVLPLHPVIPGSAARSRKCRGGAPKGERARSMRRQPRSSRSYLRNGDRVCAASLCDAASRWMRLSALRLPSFFGGRSFLVFGGAKQSSGAKAHRENGETRVAKRHFGRSLTPA